MSPTYCGKATKSWWNSQRRLSSKSESCHSGSRSAKASRRRLDKSDGNVESRDGLANNRRLGRHSQNGGKRKLVDFGHEKPGQDAEFELDGMKVRRRRRINGDNREHVDEMKA